MKAQRESAHTATCELLDLDILARSDFLKECFLLAQQGLGWEQRKELSLNPGVAATSGDETRWPPGAFVSIPRVFNNTWQRAVSPSTKLTISSVEFIKIYRQAFRRIYYSPPPGILAFEYHFELKSVTSNYSSLGQVKISVIARSPWTAEVTGLPCTSSSLLCSLFPCKGLHTLGHVENPVSGSFPKSISRLAFPSKVSLNDFAAFCFAEPQKKWGEGISQYFSTCLPVFCCFQTTTATTTK